MIGLLSLLLGAALVGVAAGRTALASGIRSRPGLLASAYVVAWAEVVLVMLGLSAVDGLRRWPLLGAFVVVAVAAVVLTRGRARPAWPLLRATAIDVRDACRSGAVALVGVVVAGILGYVAVLALATPQNDFDSIYDHLWRAVLWFADGRVGYPDCSCAPYINAYPPVAEMGVALTMVLGGSDRYVAAPQAVALLAIAVCVVGIARRIGLTRREAVFGGLLVVTLPVLALQASTAQNDLVVAAFLLAATLLLLERDRAAPWLAAPAVALAVGTKVSAPFAIPLLLVVALLGRPTAGRLGRVLSVGAGAALGGIWYLVNRHQTGALTGGYPDIPVEHTVVAALGRISRLGIEFIDLSGAYGADLYLYVVAAAVVAVVVAARRRQDRRAAVLAGLTVLVLASLPVLLPQVGIFLERVHVNVFEALGRPDLNVDIGRDVRRSASNYSWYGPLGALLAVGGVVLAVREVRRGAVDRLAVVLAVAPFYWLVAYGGVVYYLEFAGRYFMFAFALAAASWGMVLRRPPVAWAVASIAVVALSLSVLNDTKRPSGLRFLEDGAARSYFTTPRWAGQGAESRAADLTRFIDATLPSDARVALAITNSDPGYLFYGSDLDRRVTLVRHDAADAPDADWLLASPGAGRPALCDAWEQRPERPQGWWVFERRPGARCP